MPSKTKRGNSKKGPLRKMQEENGRADATRRGRQKEVGERKKKELHTKLQRT